MLKTIKNYIVSNNLIKPGNRVIVAVSGGPDSMALLHILRTLSSEMEFELMAAHINHGLRAEADEEQRFVADHCQEWCIPCYAMKADVKELARREKTSLEDAGRRVRYRFLYNLLEEHQADSIATAHHHDDVAETVLLHLLRGSGLQGLRGIMPRNGQLIRPLLSVGKEQLLEYLAEHNISYCLDQSNTDQDFVRNRIRHQLIPLLKEDYNPRIVENLNQLADIVQAENEFVESEIDKCWREIVTEQDSSTISLDLGIFSGLPRAARRRLVLRVFAQIGGSAGWEARDVEKVIELSEKKGSSKVLNLKKKLRVNKSYDKMVFTSKWSKPEQYCLPVSIPGSVSLPAGNGYHFAVQAAGEYDFTENGIYLDYDKIDLPLVLRSRREGDVFQPAGFVGHKRLKKYLIDKKIPCWERDLIPVLASEQEIYAVLGHCVCRQALVDEGTKTLLVIKKT